MHALRTAAIALAVICTIRADAFALDPPPTASQLRRWMGSECPVAGKRVGIDYARSLNRAVAKDSGGLAELFRFTKTDGFMGAAAESHTSILLGLLQRWGDDRFARVLRRQKPDIRKAVVDAIDYAFPYPGWKPSNFPITYSLAPHGHTPDA
jgi:hypothetical protein